MRLDPAQIIAGQPITQVREFLRAGRNRAWAVGLVRERLKIGEPAARKLLTELEAAGYIERDPDSRDEVGWVRFRERRWVRFRERPSRGERVSPPGREGTKIAGIAGTQGPTR